MRKMRNTIIYFTIKYKANYFDIFKAIKNNEKLDEKEFQKFSKKMLENNIKVITILDSFYPKELKHIKYPPFAIFFKGNIKLLAKEKIMLVGDSFEKSFSDIVNSITYIASKKVLLSLSFKNFDKKISDIFNKENGEIIYFSSNGLINPYMSQKNINYKQNIMISEYPFEINVSKRKFYKRNYLSSVLSDILIIYNLEKISKLSNLVNYFLENGKEIFCFPPKGDDGNLSLINDGANFITKIRV